ncbi:MAG: hypothetical protein M3Z92_08550 [Bacteroidota bacterium]|nr:hypothetical protein [Bacteroidota bacterium]MDQ6890680.1 hypothetical protein [Bacteroidota bacterium]
MNFHFQDLIPKDFDDTSRVWVYQCNRAFTLEEALQIEQLLQDFTAHWNSHGNPVKGFANLFFGQFIIFLADETATGVSGCSTDSSVRIIKNIEQDFQVQFFDRQTLAFAVDERIQLIPLALLNYETDKGIITEDTLYFNNTILTKRDLVKNWIIPVKNSWLAKRFSFSHAG